MGVIVNKNNQIDNELTRRINVETPDFAEDAEYVKNLKKTSKFGWVWIVLVLLAIAAIVAIVII